jgi:5-methylcytosine-specific restriction endonuclease McrA
MVAASPAGEGKSSNSSARKLGHSLHCALEDIRVLVNNAIGKPCPYCGVALTISNFSLDHLEPTSRGGHHCLTNMVVCCERCNQTKGPLTAQEFEALLAFLRRGNFFVAKNVLARMRAAGRAYGHRSS